MIEHYTLDRWYQFLRDSFPLVKGFSVGFKLFQVPSATELADWGERRLSNELDNLRESLARLPGREVRVFVTDQEELRREKFAQQQAAKQKAAPAPAASASGGAAPSEGKKNDKKGGNNSNNNNGNSNNNGKKEAAGKKDEGTIGHIDLRVGVVVDVEVHPDGDTLFVERIDVGEDQPRQIVSGVRQHIPADQLKGSRVLVMCNLKEKPLRGVKSNGMIVCASREDPEGPGGRRVALLDIPKTSKAGARVAWRGEQEGVVPDAAPIAANKLTKLLGALKTDAEGKVVFGEQGWVATVDGEQITCKQIPNGTVG